MSDKSPILELFNVIDQSLSSGRHEVALYALSTLLGLTNSEESLQQLYETPKALAILIELLHHPHLNEKSANLIASCLINISSYDKGAQHLINIDLEKYRPILKQNLSTAKNIVDTCYQFISTPNNLNAAGCCMILANLTRPQHLLEKIANILDIDNLIILFIHLKSDEDSKLNYIGSILANLSRNIGIRKIILNNDKEYIQSILPFIDYQNSLVRRQGVVAMLKNCCFDLDAHEWLLTEVDILPRLLLPLAGGEEFDDEDNEKLPLDLQYLPEDKQRENDPDIRCTLLEAIVQLCTKRKNREFIRDKNTYIILRELHKWEKDKKVLLACENLVDLLIRTEEEIGHENLNEIDVPDDLQETFQKADEIFLQL